MIPATVEIRRLTGKPGQGGVFTFVSWHTPQGDTYRSVYLGSDSAMCKHCFKSDCEHIAAARALVASEQQTP